VYCRAYWRTRWSQDDRGINGLAHWRNKTLGAVKPYQIFRKINRATARFLFESMVHWLRLAGYPRLVILLDAQRVMAKGRQKDQLGVFYNKPVVFDVYDVFALLYRFCRSTGGLSYGCDSGRQLS
jgi:hypothetical protein